MLTHDNDAAISTKQPYKNTISLSFFPSPWPILLENQIKSLRVEWPSILELMDKARFYLIGLPEYDYCVLDMICCLHYGNRVRINKGNVPLTFDLMVEHARKHLKLPAFSIEQLNREKSYRQMNPALWKRSAFNHLTQAAKHIVDDNGQHLFQFNSPEEASALCTWLNFCYGYGVGGLLETIISIKKQDNSFIVALNPAHYNQLCPMNSREVSLSDEPVTRCLQEGMLLVKIFADNKSSWQSFLTQLRNPNQRAKLRASRPTTAGFKFFHLQGKIGPHHKGSEVKPQHETHAKKQSMTLVTPGISSRLFLQELKGVPLVGVAMRADSDLSQSTYHPDKVKIRAMMSRSGNSYARLWCGDDEQAVAQYKEAVRDINFTSLQAFMTAIQSNPLSINEVLGEPSSGSLLAIVIGRDTPEARELARSYQNDVELALGVKLPICMYDSEEKEFKADIDVMSASHLRMPGYGYSN